jgi:hypothetical protein
MALGLCDYRAKLAALDSALRLKSPIMMMQSTVK